MLDNDNDNATEGGNVQEPNDNGEDDNDDDSCKRNIGVDKSNERDSEASDSSDSDSASTDMSYYSNKWQAQKTDGLQE